MHRRHRKLVFIATFVVCFMFTFSFIMSPLYRVVCKRTGWNGSLNVNEVNAALAKAKVDNRSILVQFVATNNANLPWEFHPITNAVEVNPNKMTTVMFYAKNNSKKPMTVQAIPSFSPANAVLYFHKVECFCFTQQTLQPGEEKKMPVVFNLDGALPEDIRTITLSYTLFHVENPKTKVVEVDKKKKLALKKKEKKLAMKKKHKQAVDETEDDDDDQG